MKKNLLLHSILTLCMTLFTAMGFAQINTNGGFESWTGTSPDGWYGSKSNIGTANVVQVTSGAHSGDYACQLINTATGHKRFSTQALHVDNSTQYVISFWVKGKGDVRVALFDNRETGSGYSTYSAYHNINSTSYQLCTDTIEAANTTDNGEFILSVKSTNADDDHLIVDDVTITAVVNENFVAEPTAAISGNLFSANTYFASATVALSTITDGAVIYYTLDGTEPTEASTLYSAPITITETSTLKAIAMLNGNSSSVFTKTITIIDLDPLFFENFESNGLSQMIVTNVSGTYSWTTAVHNNNTYAYANAYQQGATETWLLTPAITPLNAGGLVLSFSSAKNYNGPAIQVKYSTDYSGSGSPSSSTWTDITEDCALSNGSWTWTPSGDVEIPGTAPVYIAWVYTSEASSAAGWEVDNIMVLAGEYVLPPSLSITAPANGSNFSTLDTLPIGVEIENFTLGTDGFLKVETPLLTVAGLTNPVYLDEIGLNMLSQTVFTPLPVGTHTITVSLVDMNQTELNPAVTATTTFTVSMPQLDAPVFSPAAGTYADSVTFSITCANEGAEIHYTTDGSEPTETSTLYTTPITLTTTTTVKAKAFMTNWLASETSTAVYNIVYEPVLTVAPLALNFNSTQLTQEFTVSCAHLTDPVTLTCNNSHFTMNPTVINALNSNTVVSVTFDGTEPAMGTITVTSGTINEQVSLTATAQLPAPVLTPATETSDDPITVAINCTVADASIHYTTDGTEPTAQSAVYNTPIVFNTPGTYTVKALAVKTGWENSDIATGTYTMNEPPAPDTVNVPVIMPATDLYYEPQAVTITCADADAIIRYTTDGSAPTETSTIYNAPFTVTTTTTITAKAWKDSMIPSGTATVTISFPEQVANIAAFKAAAATNVEKQIMSDVTFVFRSGRFMFVEDNTAAMLIYDNSTPVITNTYNEGDVIEGGIFGKYTMYQGMVEMVPTHNANAATGTPVTVTPANATISDIKTQYTDVYESKLVHLSNVEFISNTKFVQNGDTMAIYNRFNTVTTEISAGDLADVTGFVSYSTNYGYQIYPRGDEDIDIHPVVIMDTVATPEFFFQRDGEFYRMTLTCATEGASIHYSIDGTDPDENSYEYTDAVPFQLHVHYLIKAIAMKEGMVNSAIAEYDYNPTGIESYELRDNLSVYPNPAVNNVYVRAQNDNILIERVELFNSLGQLLRTTEVGGTMVEIPVGTLATGTYYAKVFTDKGVVTMPVIRK